MYCTLRTDWSWTFHVNYDDATICTHFTQIAQSEREPQVKKHISATDTRISNWQNLNHDLVVKKVNEKAARCEGFYFVKQQFITVWIGENGLNVTTSVTVTGSDFINFFSFFARPACSEQFFSFLNWISMNIINHRCCGGHSHFDMNGSEEIVGSFLMRFSFVCSVMCEYRNVHRMWIRHSMSLHNNHHRSRRCRHRRFDYVLTIDCKLGAIQFNF